MVTVQNSTVTAMKSFDMNPNASGSCGVPDFSSFHYGTSTRSIRCGNSKLELELSPNLNPNFSLLFPEGKDKDTVLARGYGLPPWFWVLQVPNSGFQSSFGMTSDLARHARYTRHNFSYLRDG